MSIEHIDDNWDLTGLTLSAGLYGSLNVPDTLDGDTVLIVAVDVQILQLSHLVDQDTQLISNIWHVIVATLTPDRKLLLEEKEMA